AQLADLLDADLLAALFLLAGRGLAPLFRPLRRHTLRHHQPIVRMVALCEPTAGRAGAARSALARRLFAEHRLGDCLAEFVDPDALGAADQEGMGQPVFQAAPRFPRTFMPRKNHLLTNR